MKNAMSAAGPRVIMTSLSPTQIAIRLALLVGILSPLAIGASASDLPVGRRKRQFWDRPGFASTAYNLFDSGQQAFPSPASSQWGGAGSGLSAFGGSPSSFQSLNTLYSQAKAQGSTDQGVRIKSYNFYNCSSALWSNHQLWAEYFFIHPTSPRFPGNLFINMSIWINQDLPYDLDAEFEIRAETVVGFGGNPFQFIPCHGYNIDPSSNERGCGGVGSCRYCNVIEKYCKQYLSIEDCPPRRGRYALSFSQTIHQKDIPKSLFGPLKSTKYWIKVKLVQASTGSEVACGMIVLDVCKFHIWDQRETCIEGS